MVRRSSAQATALPRPASRATQRSSLQDSHLRLLTETAKREAPLEPGQLAPLAEANLEKPLAMLQENPLTAAAKRETATARLQRNSLAETM